MKVLRTMLRPHVCTCIHAHARQHSCVKGQAQSPARPGTEEIRIGEHRLNILMRLCFRPLSAAPYVVPSILIRSIRLSQSWEMLSGSFPDRGNSISCLKVFSSHESVQCVRLYNQGWAFLQSGRKTDY